MAEAVGEEVTPSRAPQRSHALVGRISHRGRILVEDPRLFLRARAQALHPADPAEAGPAAVLLADLGALGGVARRAIRHLREGLFARLLAPEREEAGRALAQARADVERLVTTYEKEARHAGRDDAGSDPAAAT